MFHLDDITNENNEDHNKKQPDIPDHLYTMLIIGGSGPGKTNTLLNLIKGKAGQNLIDKIYLYPKDLNEPKYQFLIKKREDVGIEHLQYMDDVYNNINDHNPSRKREIQIVFDDIIADIVNNKNFKQ